MRQIYLDYNASTPLAPEVAALMHRLTDEAFGNPSSTHWAGVPAREAIVKARSQVADLLGCLAEHYSESPYVHVLPVPDARLGLRQVVGSHDAAVAVGPAAHGGHVPVIATIDNLMRGAASQALVALNDWLGLDPYLGLAPPRDLDGASPR